MLKTLAALEEKIDDRTYRLICPEPTTWGELHDVLWKMKQFVFEQIRINHENQLQEMTCKGECEDGQAVS